MDWTPVFDFFTTLAPWVQYLFMGLGSLVVAGTFIDSVIPDETDKGFMTKAFAIPIIGDVLRGMAKFSPFNVKEKN